MDGVELKEHAWHNFKSAVGKPHWCCRSPWQGHQSVVRPVAPTSQLLACDDDGATVKSVILFFISPTAFRARAMLTLVVTWIQATDHPVAGCSESCFTFHCLMISTAPRYCSTYVFLVLNIFKISIQNCRVSFTRYTVLQSHARPMSVSHRYRQSVQCTHSRLNVHDVRNVRLNVRRLYVRD